MVKTKQVKRAVMYNKIGLNCWHRLLLILVFLFVIVGSVSATTYVRYDSIGRFDIEDSDGNIDDDGSTSYSGAVISGDDVENAQTSTSWNDKWLVTGLSDVQGNSDIKLSSNFAINQNQLNNTDEFGIWYDATGDGDVNDADDYPIYNDIFISDLTGDSITVKPAMRVGNSSYLAGRIFELKG